MNHLGQISSLNRKPDTAHTAIIVYKIVTTYTFWIVWIKTCAFIVCIICFTRFLYRQISVFRYVKYITKLYVSVILSWQVDALNTYIDILFVGNALKDTCSYKCLSDASFHFHGPTDFPSKLIFANTHCGTSNKGHDIIKDAETMKRKALFPSLFLSKALKQHAPS